MNEPPFDVKWEVARELLRKPIKEIAIKFEIDLNQFLLGCQHYQWIDLIIVNHTAHTALNVRFLVDANSFT